jgi:hypothetical protein
LKGGGGHSQNGIAGFGAASFYYMLLSSPHCERPSRRRDF